MPPEEELLWSLEDRECVLWRVEGHSELRLRDQGRLVRIELCPDEGVARGRAADWREWYAALLE